MDKGYERLMASLKQYEDTHTKVALPERKALINTLYQLLGIEMEDYTDYAYSETESEITITITAEFFITCDDGGHNLNILIGMANLSEINIVDNKIVIKLWFRLWEWVDKEEIGR